MILHTDVYDPSAVDEKPSGQYMSRKDLRNVLIGFALILLALWPVYNFLKRNTEEHICKRNMKEIAEALNLYAQDNEDHFPPVFEATAPGSSIPKVNANGAAICWVTALSHYVDDESIFVCPSADESEYTKVEGRDGKTINCTYGFYAPYSTALRSAAANPGRTVVISETSNFGASNTYDPLKRDEVRQDGFIIAFDNNALEPDEQSKAVTRLAFPNTADGSFKSDGDSRHAGGVHALTVEGSLMQIAPDAASYSRENPYWSVPIRSIRRTGF